MLELHLSDALLSLMGWQRVLSHCTRYEPSIRCIHLSLLIHPRDLVKFVWKNYDNIFSSKVQRRLSFTTAAFEVISQVLNAKHLRCMFTLYLLFYIYYISSNSYFSLAIIISVELQWTAVNEAVAQSIRILKDLEKLNIRTSASVKELENLWPQVDMSELAFSLRKVFSILLYSLSILTCVNIYQNLQFLSIEDVLPFPEMEAPKSVQVSLSIPEGIIPGISPFFAIPSLICTPSYFSLTLLQFLISL